MTPRRLALALVLAVVAASVGVGAATPGVTDAAAVGAVSTPTPANETAPIPLGQSISSVMQASAAQAAGTVENGMWAAAYANASNASEKRDLVERRYGELDGTLAELQAERRALRTAFRNGSIDRATYLARLSALVGQLAAAGEGIEVAGDRGAEVGVNATRLEELRSQARTLGGAEVSRMARNLAGGQGQPGPPGLFGEGAPGAAGDRGPPTDAGNRSQSGNAGQSGAGGQGPPADADQQAGDDEPTATPTDADA